MLFKIPQLPGQQFQRVPAKSPSCQGCVFLEHKPKLCRHTQCTPASGQVYIIKEVGVDYGKGARRYGDPIVIGKRYQHHGSERCPVPDGYGLVVFFGGAQLCGTPTTALKASKLRWSWVYNGEGGDITSYVVFSTYKEAVKAAAAYQAPLVVTPQVASWPMENI